MSNEIAVRESGALDFRASTDAAGACKEIVIKTAQNIGGRKYVRVEGWQSIAIAHGCVASSRDVERIDGGVRAIGEVRRGSDGALISTAEGFVGDDESTWSKRLEYAKRAMAQTRAISRACRSAFAHVVVMMDAGLETTPAEEVPHGASDDAPAVKPVTMPKAKPVGKGKPSAKAEPEPFGDGEVTTVAVVVVEKTGMKGNRYWFKAHDGEYYSTFDTNMGQDVIGLEEGDEVVVTYTVSTGKDGKEYKNLVELSLSGDIREPGHDNGAEQDNIRF